MRTRHALISDTDTDDRVNMVAQALFERLNFELVGRQLDRDAVTLIKNAIDRYTAKARGEGIPMPDLTYVVIPELGVVEIFRKDLDRQQVMDLVPRFMNKYKAKNIHLAHIFPALMQAFPHYRKLDG